MFDKIDLLNSCERRPPGWEALRNTPMCITRSTRREETAHGCEHCCRPCTPACCWCPTGPAGGSGSLGGIQMQMVSGGSRIIPAGQNLLFDTAINDQSPNISYDPLSGQFVFHAPGNYFISWWVATDGSAAATDLWFSVMVNSAGLATGATPLVTGQLNGSALVTVSTVPTVVALANATPAAVALASTPVQANIVILQVS